MSLLISLFPKGEIHSLIENDHASTGVKVIIQSTPKVFIRCDQVGDWEYGQDTIIVFVSQECGTTESQLAIGIHELIEAFLCRKRGITDKTVCAFDEMYEKERTEGKHRETDEPGDDPRSPYRDEHMAATHVERAVCSALGLSWEHHGRSLQ